MKSKLITLTLQLILTLIRWLPKSWVPAIARLSARLIVPLAKRDRQLIDSNLLRVYKLPPHSAYAKRFRYQVFQSQVTILLETFKTILSPTPLMTIDGLDELKATILQEKQAGRGLIVVTAHCGSWETVAASTAKVCESPFYALAKPSNSPEFTKILGDLRHRVHTKVLWTDSKNLLRDMLKVLRNGECLGFVMDQKPEGRVGPIVSFLGQATEFVAGPAKLAVRQQCPVIAIFCMRTAPWHYKLNHQVIAPAHHGLDDEQALTQSMAHALEECIRLYPEQWVWNYKRWRFPTLQQSVEARREPSGSTAFPSSDPTGTTDSSV